jgi:NitT/TauT family transport system substrate-binding protein
VAAGIGALLVCWALPARAVADDTLVLIGGSNSAGFYEVLEHTAERAGFFKEEHLNVVNQYTSGASSAAQLVASGKADIAGLSVEAVLQGYDHGLRLVLFWARDPTYNNVLGVLDNSPIRTLADFKGKDIGEVNVGATAEYAVGSMLAGAGLRKSDYTFVPIGVGAQAFSAIASGRVAGAAFPSVELVLEGAAGNAKFRFFRHPLFGNVVNALYAASPETIATKADQLTRFCRAMVKASLLVRENPAVAARYFLEGSGAKVTDESVRNETQLLTLLQGNLPAADPSNERIGYIPPRGMAFVSTFFAENGWTSLAVPPSAIMTDRFIAGANDFDRKALVARIKQMQ